MIKRQEIQPIGMRQDNLIGTNQSSKYAHEIKNLRFNTTGDYTTASWVTEQGTLYKPLNVIGNSAFPMDNTNQKLRNQVPIGQAVINDNWILFTTVINRSSATSYDFIYKLWFTNTTLNIKLLYKGDLNFSAEHPLETTTYYENEKIQKVYWTDGINQPRVINIADGGVRWVDNHDDQFDFVKKVELDEIVEVTKHQGGAGQFPPGTVKYALTYYNKYGQESNIIWTSTLLYPMRGERACSPDELSGDEFKIKITNINLKTYENWERIRLYSIVRSVEDSTPVVRLVDDRPLIKTSSNTVEDIVFIDSNTAGEIIDPTILNYVGGRDITAETFDQKDNTLFLGNLHLKRKSLKSIIDANRSQLNENSCYFDAVNTICKKIKTVLPLPPAAPGDSSRYVNSFYPWSNQLNECKNPKVFKRGEWYRVGLQCQDELGNWSDVVFLKDIQYTEYINGASYPQCQNTTLEMTFPVIRYSLTAGLRNILKNAGYKRVRLVCCFPTNNDRSILAQGALCPTTVQEKWQSTNSPYYMSSWFYRFKNSKLNPTINIDVRGRGDALKVNIDLHSASSNVPMPEVQTMELYGDKNYGNNASAVLTPEKSKFREDCWAFTFHSPDIEFDESIRTLDWSNVKMRIVGRVYQNSFATKLYLDYTKQAEDYAGNKGRGFDDKGKTELFDFSSPTTTKSFDDTFKCFGYWNDIDVYNSNALSSPGVLQTWYYLYDYRIYPFQRKHLGNYMGDLNIDVYKNNAKDPSFTVTDSSILNSKIWSTLRVSAYTTYTRYNPGIIDNAFLTDCIKIFDSNEVIPIQLDGDHVYFGNIDAVCPIEPTTNQSSIIYEYQGLFNSEYTSDTLGIDIKYANVNEPNTNQCHQTGVQFTQFNGSYTIFPEQSYYNIYAKSDTNVHDRPGGNHGQYLGVSSDAVYMRYKSTPHCIITTNLPARIENRVIGGTSLHPITVYDRDFKVTNGTWIAELYRDDITADQRFGGNSEVAKLHNVYVPCSKSYNLNSLNASQNTLIHDEGDTYYMRYDNLKTYPFAIDDVNQIVEIFSFMCETRVNLDGRYDKNRGLTDNTKISNTNFNYINKSYTQTDNFFTYRLLDTLSTQLDNFSNQITWTKTKVAGELVDTWTNLTLASVADADGTLGEITKILNVNDNLILFQDHGIAHIGYNEKTALSTSNGVPLEIANSGKFTGFNYSTKTVGCQNKWSISNTKNGCWFIDDSRRELNAISEGLQPISTINGFDAFMIDNLRNAPEEWNPNQFLPTINTASNFVSYYDKLTKDVYYINKDYCLTWNEITKTFTSFYDYNSVPYVSSVGQHCMMTHLDSDQNNNTYCSFYAARESDGYSHFFRDSRNKDISRPYWITLLADGGEAFVADKVFNNVEYRGDLFDEHSPVIVDADNFNPPNTNLINAINMPLFTDIAAYNGYQAYKEFKIDGRYNLSNNPIAYREYPWKAERKFNIWRVIVPRATYTQPNGSLATGRDRIRNPFCYIKLVNNEPDRTIAIARPRGVASHRAIFHDFAVYYDMK